MLQQESASTADVGASGARGVDHPLSHAKFTKAERLLRGWQYNRAFEQGVSIRSDTLSVQVAHNELGWPRLGLVVSRKVGRAVRRNRIKRVVREVFRLNKRWFMEGEVGCDVVVVARGRETSESFEALSEELHAMVDRALHRLRKRIEQRATGGGRTRE